MEIIVANSKDKVLINFDSYGNIYFQTQSNPDKVYELSINGKSQLELFESDLKLDTLKSESDTKTGKLNYTSNPKSLKGEVMRQMVREEEDQDENDVNSDIDDSDEEYYKDKYFVEDKEYFEDYDDDASDQENDEEYFVFCSGEDQVKVYEAEDVLALYETILYHGNIEHGYAVFKTKLVGSLPLYRLNVYNEGTVLKFREIGQLEKLYELFIENDTLHIKQKN
jgi:hypothetical protein